MPASSHKLSLAFCLMMTLPLYADSFKTNITGIDSRNMDPSTSACHDFFQHANGGWVKNNPVPDAYSSWGVSNEVRDRNYILLKKILNDAAADRQAIQGSNQQKIGDFYATAMDTEKLEKEGILPLKADLAAIEDIETVDQLVDKIIDFHQQGRLLVFDTGVFQDLKDSNRNILYVTQSGLGLPEKDYYFKDDSDSKTIRKKYLKHVQSMLELSGYEAKKAKLAAHSIMSLETALAEASLDQLALRDPENYYNMLGTKEADKQTPNFLWTHYFNELGVTEMDEFSFAHPKFLTAMDRLLVERPLEDWKAYLHWHLTHQSANFLHSDLVNEHFDFYGKTLRGSKSLRPRWKRVLGQTNQTMGEALGELYVALAFPPETKERALKMVDHLKSALKIRLQNMPWMSEATRKKALEKLSTFKAKIGYPNRWKDYSTLTITRDNYLSNVLAGQAYQFRMDLAKLGQAVDREEWSMNPQTVNAYYSPLKNEVVFPAAIMQPPYFDGAIDDAVNYGAMGAIIGHELLHGYDDKGSRFDAQGNLSNWWSTLDRSRFLSRTKSLVNQFNQFTIPGGQNVNGELTLGENIADLGGLIVSWDAFQVAMKENPGQIIDGLTPEQRFFYAYAQSWRKNYRDEALKLQVNTDVHAPSMFRTNGPLINMPVFHQAFSCQSGDAMVSTEADRVVIW